TASAQTPTSRTWSGAGNNSNWSEADNWTNGVPLDGDSLVFPAGAMRLTNNNDCLTRVGNVSISTNGYSFSGNTLTLSGTFGNTGDNTWNIPLKLTATGKSFTSIGGTLTLSGNIDNGGNTITLNASYATGFNGPIIVSGILSGTGGLIKDGEGIVTLTHDNTYSGKTTITAGKLAVSKDSNLGTVPGTADLNIELNGGFLEATSTFTLNNKRLVKITMTGGKTGFWADSGATLTYGGVISAMNTSTSYGLMLDGDGTIVLSGTNTYNGGTTIYAYVTRISNAKAFGSSGSTLVEVCNLSTLELVGGITVSKPLSLDYAQLVNVSGNNTWSGEIQTFINTSGKSFISANAGTKLTVSGSIFVNTDIETSPLNTFENLYVEGAGDIDITDAIDGNGTDGASGYLLGHGDVVMDGTGTLTLSGANTYSGRTIVNSGCVSIGADNNLGAVPASATAGRVLINGGTLKGTADFTLNGNRGIALGALLGSGAGTIQIEAGCTVDYPGIMADSGEGADEFFKTGAGTFSLSGANAYSGSTTISNGTVQIGNGGTTGSLNANSAIVNGGTLAFNRTDTLTQGAEFNSVISGTGSVAQVGSGTVFLNGANTYTGPTAVNAGKLLVVNTTGSGTGSGAVTVNDTGTLGGTGTISGSVTAKSGGTVDPGVNGVGKLKISGNTAFEAGSTYKVDTLAEADSCDKTDNQMTGTLALGDGVAVLDIGTLQADQYIIASNVVSDGVTGYFKDTAGNILENDSALHLQTNYYIHYVNQETGGYILLNTSPTAAEILIQAYASADGVVVEFQTIEEAGMNDIVLFLRRNGQWVEVGRKAAAGEGSHLYRFVVPGLNAGDVADFKVRDDEGQDHTANALMVGDFTAKMVRMEKNGMTLQWASIPDRTYTVYRASQLQGPWDPVATITAVQTQTEIVVPLTPSQPVGFFKINMRD
ncbi:MAG: autotransporter-associated beta strand repeat-containing protein, partial [Kiritimatiellia bacterium]